MKHLNHIEPWCSFAPKLKKYVVYDNRGTFWNTVEVYPTGPQYGSLMKQGLQLDETENFLNNLLPFRLGKYGRLALVASYFGNIVDDDGRPVSCKDWHEVTDLLDKYPEVMKVCLESDERFLAINDLISGVKLCFENFLKRVQ